MLPFRLDLPEQIAGLRPLLGAIGYTTEQVCRRAGIASIYEFRTLREGRATATELRDGTDVLIRLFLDGEAVARDRVRSLLPERAVSALEVVGLIRPHPRDADLDAATVLLYPAGSRYIASDLRPTAPGIRDPDQPLPHDTVHPAISRNTGDFLNALPSTPCETLLELCSGTGIAALVGARYARHAWTVGVAERSTRFAEFNALLNGVTNVTALQGDLYAAVPGQRFHRIVAHPPNVAAATMEYVFGDEVADGEQIVRRIVEGLPEHLIPGGSFHCTCTATDRAGAPLEERIRSFLGGRQAEFDVLLVTSRSSDPTEYFFLMAASGRITFEEAGERHRLCQEMGVERLVYGTVLIRRHDAPQVARTLRRGLGAETGAAEMDWVLRWEQVAAQPDLPARLLDSHPRILPQARLQLEHHAEGGEWRAATCRVTTEYPFPYALEMPPEAAIFLARCDGGATVREHLLALRSAGVVPPQVSDAEFAGMVRSAAAAGLVEVEQCPLPRPERARSGRARISVGRVFAPGPQPPPIPEP